MAKATTTAAVLALVVAAAGLAGCQEEEQGRVLLYDKGTYLGEADDPLSEDEVRALRGRAKYQAGG